MTPPDRTPTTTCEEDRPREECQGGMPPPPLYDLLKENTTGTMAKRTEGDCIPKPLNEPTQATSGQRKEAQRHTSVSRAGGSGDK